MLESNFKAINHDANTLLKDAKALFQAAAALSGEKAEELRERGMRLLETTLANTQDAQENALAAGKEMAASADDYIRENPWRAITVVAGIALLAGVMLGRK